MNEPLKRREDWVDRDGGQDRRQPGHVTRREFTDFVHHFADYRDETKGVLDQITTALFAEDDQNQNKQPGLMHTARNIDNHIRTVCNIAKWIFRSIVGLLTIGAPTVAIGKALGWW
jgi:hypothetical protein